MLFRSLGSVCVYIFDILYIEKGNILYTEKGKDVLNFNPIIAKDLQLPLFTPITFLENNILKEAFRPQTRFVDLSVVDINEV